MTFSFNKWIGKVYIGVHRPSIHTNHEARQSAPSGGHHINEKNFCYKNIQQNSKTAHTDTYPWQSSRVVSSVLPPLSLSLPLTTLIQSRSTIQCSADECWEILPCRPALATKHHCQHAASPHSQHLHRRVQICSLFPDGGPLCCWRHEYVDGIFHNRPIFSWQKAVAQITRKLASVQG